MTPIPAQPPRPDHIRREPPPQPRLELSGTQVLASGLASLTAALVASFFGVAGTIIGAAVVGVVWTLGSALYRYGLGRTQLRLQQSGPAVLRARPGRSAARDRAGDRGTADVDRVADTAPAEASATAPLAATEEHHPGRAPGGWRAWLSRRRVGVAVAVVIVLASSLAVISLVELVARQPLSGITGGEPSGRTSIGSLFDGGDAETPDETTTTTTTTTTPGAPAPGAPAPPTTAPGGAEGDEPPTTEEQTTTTSATSTTLAPEPAPDDEGG